MTISITRDQLRFAIDYGSVILSMRCPHAFAESIGTASCCYLPRSLKPTLSLTKHAKSLTWSITQCVLVSRAHHGPLLAVAQTPIVEIGRAPVGSGVALAPFLV
jgi:hypothetical protein